MDAQLRKKIKRDYLEDKKRAGIYQIGVENHQRCILSSSHDIDSVLNRHQSEFRFGTHLNRDLQRLWKEQGEEGFFFKIIDVLEPLDELDYNPKDDLEELLEIWEDKIAVNGLSIY